MKLSSIVLSFIILVQSSGLSMNDIIQMDEFIEHAQFHNQQYGDNILVFVSKHYGALKIDHDIEHKEESSDHEKLPFQYNIHMSSTVMLLLISPHSIELKAPDFFEIESSNFYYKALSSSQYSRELFQPPRLS
ncbi:MAG: hypothetical protein V7719_06470 [Psychroserpens sp.]|uniref:hypothetical protein n=1 Tax=Psychroserpens sp. TaxID=2020870 RepID=UPI00300186AF